MVTAALYIQKTAPKRNRMKHRTESVYNKKNLRASVHTPIS